MRFYDAGDDAGEDEGIGFSLIEFEGVLVLILMIVQMSIYIICLRFIFYRANYNY
jgi:hypothetical protein